MCRPLKKGPLSSGGRRVRSVIDVVSLSGTAISAATPHRALATLLHELCHAFGSDGSVTFGAALTDVLERVASLPAPLQALASDWSGQARPQE